MANRIDLSNILINFLKKARYERHIKEGTLEENQFYAVTDGNEKTEYGDLFGNIENQADLYNALYASRLFKMEMCNDVRGYDIVHKLYDRREFDLSKFTVVGNPVISEDGIASGFSSGNYLAINNVIDWTSPFKIFFKFKTSTLPNVEQSVFSKYTQNSKLFYFYIHKDGEFVSYDGAGRFYLSTTYPTANTTYYGVWEYDGTKQFIKLGTTEENLTTIIDNMGVPENTSLSGLNIGIFSNGTINNFLGSIDLKYFSITVDGTEVFNGLKDLTQYDTYTLPSSEVITIPYIPSVDGVKIVDVAYKPLVDQLYTETGVGNYIIIDETNKTFRLPLPDIYSQIENKTSFTLRKWED